MGPSLTEFVASVLVWYYKNRNFWQTIESRLKDEQWATKQAAAGAAATPTHKTNHPNQPTTKQTTKTPHTKNTK
jgi:hypothetical protein